MYNKGEQHSGDTQLQHKVLGKDNCTVIPAVP